MRAVDAGGWVYFPGGSANGSRYKVINRALTFYAAQGECGGLGGHLARVNSIREQVFLEDFLAGELDIEGKVANLVTLHKQSITRCKDTCKNM